MRHTFAVLTALALSISLSGCGLFSGDGKGDAQAKAAAKEPKPIQTPLTETEVKQMRDDINSAMDAIPPELRNDFQTYFACEIKRDKSPMTAKRIREMTAALKADRGVARCNP